MAFRSAAAEQQKTEVMERPANGVRNNLNIDLDTAIDFLSSYHTRQLAWQLRLTNLV
jgi:hypothetical protein